MNALVTGAGGLVGGVLADRLEALGIAVVRAGRRARAPDWLAWDMAAGPPRPARRFQCVVHTAPLWVLPGHLEHLAGSGATRVIGFSSTSVVTKRASAGRIDRTLAGALQEAERQVRRESERLGLCTTLFRPTMIYGYGRDRNVTAIAGFIRRWGFFPVAGKGSGRRQPVHVDDVAQAAVSVLNNPVSCGRTYDLTGGETLSYRRMVERIFEALGKRPRIVAVPTAAYRCLLTAAGLLGARLTADVADRMNQDMVFDSHDARVDLSFVPQGFLQHPERDLAAA